MIVSRSGSKALPCALLFGLLAACGGDEEPGAFDEGVDMSGLYFGNLVGDDAGATSARLIVEEDGNFYLFTLLDLYIGHLRTDGTSFTANATGYSFDLSFPDGSEFDFQGIAEEEGSVEGAYTGNGASGTLSLEYGVGVSNLPASLAVLQGAHDSSTTVRDADAVTGSLSVQSDGDFIATYAGGCAIDGAITVREADGNIYGWSAQLSGCASNGAAEGIGYRTLEDQVRLYGTIGGMAVMIYFDIES